MKGSVAAAADGRAVGGGGEAGVRRRLAWLRASPALAGVGAAGLAEVARRATEVAFPGGARVIEEGTPGEAFYVVGEGGCVAQNGRGERLAEYGPRDCFGERALVTREARAADVVARDGGCTLLRVDKPSFEALLWGCEGLAALWRWRSLLCQDALRDLALDARLGLVRCVREDVLPRDAVVRPDEMMPVALHILEAGSLVVEAGAGARAEAPAKSNAESRAKSDAGPDAEHEPEAGAGQDGQVQGARFLPLGSCFVARRGKVLLRERGAAASPRDEASRLPASAALLTVVSRSATVLTLALEDLAALGVHVHFDDDAGSFVVRVGSRVRAGARHAPPRGSAVGNGAPMADPLRPREPWEALVPLRGGGACWGVPARAWSQGADPPRLTWGSAGGSFEREPGEDVAAPPAIGHPIALPGRLRDLSFQCRLGKGAFGYVSLVEANGLHYALKAVRLRPPDETNAARHLEKVSREVDVMCHMRGRSKFLVNLLCTYEEDEGMLYMLMEPVVGGDFWSLLQECRRLSELQARFYLACAVEAVDALHSQGIVYRDLKPENLLVDACGYLKLADFGLSRFLPWSCPAGDEGGRRAHTLCGTPQYIAPEVLLGKAGKGYDRAVDWWALGVLLFEMVCGYVPFGSHSATDAQIFKNIVQGRAHVFVRGASAEFRDLVRKLMHPNSKLRLGMLKGGADDVRQHAFFAGFDWVAFRRHELPSPMLPVMKAVQDRLADADAEGARKRGALAAPKFYVPGTPAPPERPPGVVPKHVADCVAVAWENFV